MYSTGEAAELVGATPRNVMYWAKIGLTTPTIPPTGIGSAARYTYTDLLVLSAVAEVAQDTSVSLRRRIAHAMREPGLLEEGLVDVISRVRISPVLEVYINVGRIRERLRKALADHAKSDSHNQHFSRERKSGAGSP